MPDDTSFWDNFVDGFKALLSFMRAIMTDKFWRWPLAIAGLATAATAGYLDVPILQQIFDMVIALFSSIPGALT